MPISKPVNHSSSLPCPPAKEVTPVRFGGDGGVIQSVSAPRYIPYPPSIAAVNAKTLASRSISPTVMAPYDIRKLQHDIANSMAQLNQNYTGLMLMHSGNNGTFNGLQGVPGILFQPNSGNPIEVNSNASNMPLREQERFRHMDQMFCQQPSHAINVLCQQLAENQLQIVNNISQMSAWEANQQGPQSLLQQTLLSNYTIPPQAISLNNFPGIFQDPPYSQPLQPWLPLGYKLQPGSNGIHGFHSAQSHWVPGAAPPPICPKQPGFYFMPKPPYPGAVFRNPVHPFHHWNEWANNNNQQAPLNLYPGLSSNQGRLLNQENQVKPKDTSSVGKYLPPFVPNKEVVNKQSEDVKEKVKDSVYAEKLEALIEQLKLSELENHDLKLELEESLSKEQALQGHALAQQAELEHKLEDSNKKYQSLYDDLDELTATAQHGDENNSDISKLRHALQHAKESIQRLNDEKQEIITILESKQVELDHIRLELGQKSNETSALKKNISELSIAQSELKQKNNEISILKKKLADRPVSKEESNSTNSEQVNILQKKLQASESEGKEIKIQLNDNIVKSQKMNTAWEQENANLKKECLRLNTNVDILKTDLSKNPVSTDANLKTEILELKSDLNNLRDRLSQAAGNKLRDNNPNIADLSDMNRPTSLADKFNSLYTDEYTDCIEVLEERLTTEKESTKKMYDIMMSSFDVALDFKKELLKNTAKSLFLDESEMENSAIKASMKDIFRNPVAKNKYIKSIQDKLLDKFKDLPEKGNEYVIKYCNKCADLSFYMVITDPPLALVSPEEGDSLDKVYYNAFTSNGKLIDYVVWPKLILHEGGPMLAKGICQGKD